MEILQCNQSYPYSDGQNASYPYDYTCPRQNSQIK